MPIYVAEEKPKRQEPEVVRIPASYAQNSAPRRRSTGVTQTINAEPETPNIEWPKFDEPPKRRKRRGRHKIELIADEQAEQDNRTHARESSKPPSTGRLFLRAIASVGSRINEKARRRLEQVAGPTSAPSDPENAGKEVKNGSERVGDGFVQAPVDPFVARALQREQESVAADRFAALLMLVGSFFLFVGLWIFLGFGIAMTTLGVLIFATGFWTSVDNHRAKKPVTEQVTTTRT